MVGVNILTNLFGKLVIAGAAFIAVPIYIKYLGKDSYSLISLLTTIQAVFILLDGGISAGYLKHLAFLTKYKEKNKEKIYSLAKSLEYIFILLSLIILLVIYLFRGDLVSEWLNVPDDLKKIAVESFSFIAVIVSIKFLLLYYYSTLKGFQKFPFINILVVFVTILKFLLSVIFLAYYDGSVVTVFKIYTIVSIIELFLAKYTSGKMIGDFLYNRKIAMIEINEIKRFVGLMAVVSITSAILSQVDKLIISSHVSLEDYSYYAIASLIASVPLLITSPISSAVYPKMVQLIEDEKATKDFYIKYSILIAIVIFPLISYYIINSNYILLWWVNDIKIVDKTNELSIFLISGSTILSMMSMPYFLSLSYGKVKIPLITNLLTIVLSIPLLVILIPHIGILAGGVTWLFLNTILMILFIYYLHKNILVGIRIKWYSINIILLFIISIITLLLNFIFKDIIILENVIIRGVLVVLLIYFFLLKWWNKCYSR
ncbi:hypothetical protein AYY19_08490 [Photobacterium aquimaris]|uniref:oligosaccharide flippase family protein n=1 Tax=Photobacterium aquimaris TaxID=512643 RepID=UPI0007EEFBD7|nr:oligosaccharide flippase family protein [Photobacterium aquimaris]OBU11941.1 hypothetical protein AYY19_08490 [Photobacterium aquimaris]PSW01975.1 hypothetical protein CTM91_06785 [Photobacterium aquimaris]